MFINFCPFIKLQSSFTIFMMFLPFHGSFFKFPISSFYILSTTFRENAYDSFTISNGYVLHQILKNMYH